MATDYAQHPVSEESPYATIYALEYSLFKWDVAVLQDTTLVSTYDCTQDLAVHVPLCTFVLILVPMYDPTHHRALLVYTGAEQQPNLETLLEVQFNPCDVSL